MAAGHGPVWAMATLTVSELLEGHVGLDVECLDRVPQRLRTEPAGEWPGGLVHDRASGLPICSPAIMEKIGTAFRRRVKTFAEEHQVPIGRFGKEDRKPEAMRPYLQRQAATGRPGLAAIGVAQEYQNVFAAHQREERGSTGYQVWFSLHLGRPAGDLLLLLPVGRELRAVLSSRSAPTSATR